MARIQNPQNEKGEKLATEIMVNNTITECLAPLENRLEDSFENINSGDQFISIDKINADKNEEGDFFKTTISANVTESPDDIDKTSAETNKLVTSTVLKEVKDSISDKFDDALDDHINDNDKHVTEEDREKWDKADTAIQSISAGNYINISETNTISVTNIADNIVTNSNVNDSKLATVGAVRSHLSDLETTIDDLDIAYKEANKELESKLYTDFSFDSFEEGNDNYGTAYGFIIDENIFGKIKNIKIKCADYERNDRTYLKIIDENNNIIGRSETDAVHGANKILNFEFKNVTLERGKTYKAIFSSTNSITDISAHAACVRVNHEGNANHTAPSLVTPVLDSNFNIQLGSDGKPVYVIVGFDISAAVNDLAVIIQNNQLNHINDRIKHIFPEDYSYGNLNYTDFPFRGVSTSYGYGFIWKPETSAHISNIAISLKTNSGIYIYNPGGLSESILNASGPVSMCIKITDSSNNKVIGTSRVINIPAGAKNYQIISIPFDTLVPCIKNKTYIVTYHSSETAEKPDVVLPVNFSFLEGTKPITTDYTIKKLITDTNNNEYYTEGPINDKTLNSDNQTYMDYAYLEHLCVKVSATRYTHPELELVANSIGDVWEYLGAIRTYISQL